MTLRVCLTGATDGPAQTWPALVLNPMTLSLWLRYPERMQSAF